MIEDQNQPVIFEDNPKQTWVWIAAGIGIFIFVGAILLVGAVLYFDQSGNNPLLPPPVIPSREAYANPRNNTLGDPNAPVTMIEYGDYQCPFCRRFWETTEPKLIQDYVVTGKVYFVYRSAGGFIGPESGDAAEAAYCAGDQGKFWEYHDVLFANQGGENVGAFSASKLLNFANALKLEVASFKDCINSGKYAQRVQQDATDMQTDGARATPSFLINGVLVEGAQPYETFQQAIQAALQRQ